MMGCQFCKIREVFPSPCITETRRIVQFDDTGKEWRRGLWDWRMVGTDVCVEVTYFEHCCGEIYRRSVFFPYDEMEERAEKGCLCARLVLMDRFNCTPLGVGLPVLYEDGTVLHPRR